MFGGHVASALASLRLSKWRTIFTMLGIIIGISSVVTIVSLGEGLKHQIVGQINDLGSDVVTVRPGKLISRGPGGQANLNLLALLSISTFTPDDVKAIQNLSSVSTAVPIDFVTNTAASDDKELDNVFVAGTSADMASLMHVKVNYGGFFDSGDDTQNVAIIGRQVALKMFGEENPVGSTVNISGQDFIVHGVLAPSASGVLSIAQADFNYAVFIPFQPALDLANGHANILQILAKSKNPKKVDKTIGQIMMQFFTEGLVLTIGGGIIGILLSLAINALIRIYSSWEPIISIWVIAIAVGFSILVGIIFSTIPALKAARKDPIDALRGD
jgi:putative ABC transport system permease protein